MRRDRLSARGDAVLRPATAAGALRAALYATVGSLLSASLVAFVAFSWHRAQVTGRQTAPARGYVAGDPFPWLTLAYPALIAVVLVVYAAVQWAQFARLRREE